MVFIICFRKEELCGTRYYAKHQRPFVCIQLSDYRYCHMQGKYVSGYMDIPLGVAFLASLCLAVIDGADYYGKAFGVSMLSAMLVMIKPSGIIFVGVVCLVYLVNEYISKEFQMMSNAKLFLGD